MSKGTLAELLQLLSLVAPLRARALRVRMSDAATVFVPPSPRLAACMSTAMPPPIAPAAALLVPAG